MTLGFRKTIIQKTTSKYKDSDQIYNDFNNRKINHIVSVNILNENGKRIRDAALYTFVYHYTFAAKSKSLII